MFNIPSKSYLLSSPKPVLLSSSELFPSILYYTKNFLPHKWNILYASFKMGKHSVLFLNFYNMSYNNWRNPACELTHFSHVRLFGIPWIVACQGPLSMEFSRQEYQSGLPFPSPGHLPDPGIEPVSPALAGRFFTTSTTWEVRCRNPRGYQNQRRELFLSGNINMNTICDFKLVTQVCTDAAHSSPRDPFPQGR